MVGVDQVAEAVGEGEALVAGSLGSFVAGAPSVPSVLVASEGSSGASVRSTRVTPRWLEEADACEELVDDPLEPQALTVRAALKHAAAISSRRPVGWERRKEGNDVAVGT